MILVGGKEDNWSEEDLAGMGRCNRRVRFPKFGRALLKALPPPRRIHDATPCGSTSGDERLD
jgi:hypothetical protein